MNVTPNQTLIRFFADIVVQPLKSSDLDSTTDFNANWAKDAFMLSFPKTFL